jgi:hypothetical protein
MTFIEGIWGMVSFWEAIKLFRKHPLQGAFFGLTALACRNELLMRISHCVHLCEVAATEFELGKDAEKTLDEVKELFARGDTQDRKTVVFDDCGVKPFRDKILAHPLNHCKVLHDKERYLINLKWDTVEATLNKIKLFASQVECHNNAIGVLDVSTYKEGVGLESSFKSLVLSLEASANYRQLQRAIMEKGGRATVALNLLEPGHDIVIEG